MILRPYKYSGSYLIGIATAKHATKRDPTLIANNNG